MIRLDKHIIYPYVAVILCARIGFKEGNFDMAYIPPENYKAKMENLLHGTGGVADKPWPVLDPVEVHDFEFPIKVNKYNVIWLKICIRNS